MSVKIHSSKTVTDQKAYWVTPSNNASLQPQELINIDFRSPQLKRKCIETALITSPTNQLHEKNLPPKKKIMIEKPSENELSTFYSSLMQSEKNLLFLESFLALLTSSNQMPFKMKTNSRQNYIQRNLSIYPLKTFLSNISAFMKRLQSHKKRH